MGDSLKELGKLQEAIDCYKEALETNNDGDDYWNLPKVICWNNLGACLNELGQFDEASDYLEEA